jgi:hypothetical protein
MIHRQNSDILTRERRLDVVGPCVRELHAIDHSLRHGIARAFILLILSGRSLWSLDVADATPLLQALHALLFSSAGALDSGINTDTICQWLLLRKSWPK